MQGPKRAWGPCLLLVAACSGDADPISPEGGVTGVDGGTPGHDGGGGSTGGADASATGTDGSFAATGDASSNTGGGLLPADLPKAGYLAMADNHPCVVTPSDSVACESSIALRDEQPGPYRMVSAYDGKICALGLDDMPTCWLGINPPPDPMLGPLLDIQGDNLPISVTSDGSAIRWGDGTVEPETLYESGVKQIDGPRGGQCFLLNDGRVEFWRSGEKRDESAGPFVQVAGGNGHCCALTVEGRVECMAVTLTAGDHPPNETFVQVAAGFRYGCGILADQSLTCWGSNSSIIDNPPPTEGKFVEIAGEYSGACAVREDGAVLCWGHSDDPIPDEFRAKVAL